jgi:hypothetical protein
MAKNWTQKLRQAQDKYGARIVCSLAPHEGEDVVYRPRWVTDREPWILAEYDGMPVPLKGYRYSGRECHAIYPGKEQSGNS